MQETRVQSLGLEDPLEKEMATPSSILAWEIPWTEEPGGLWSLITQESDTAEHTHIHTQLAQAIQIFSYSAKFISYLVAQMVKNLPAMQET